MSTNSELPLPHQHGPLNGFDGALQRPAAESTGARSEMPDHWLDEALRTVPLPSGFLTRMSHLADAALREPVLSDDQFGRRAPGRVR